MLLIAQNHLQLIVEMGLMLFVSLVFILNLIPLSLSVVTFLSLFLIGGFTVIFGADIVLLVISMRNPDVLAKVPKQIMGGQQGEIYFLNSLCLHSYRMCHRW